MNMIKNEFTTLGQDHTPIIDVQQYEIWIFIVFNFILKTSMDFFNYDFWMLFYNFMNVINWIFF